MDATGAGKRPRVYTRPTFVVGAMRSGTTLMRLMLSRHSSLAIPPESHFLAKLVRRFDATEVLQGARLDEAITCVTSNVEWQRDWHGDPDALRRRIDDLAPPMSLAGFIDAVFSQQIEPTGKPQWGDKTPAYLFQVDRLRACFPDAHFVAMVRDPRDAYLSLAPKDWVGRSTWQVGRYLLRCDQLVDQMAADHGDHFLVVRYEDVVTDAEATLRRVCSFLDLAYEPTMQDFHRDAIDNVQPWELVDGTHQKLLRPIDRTDMGRWQREGSRSDMREVEAITHEAMDRFGYERTVSAVAVPFITGRARARHHLREPRIAVRALGARLRPSGVAHRS
jgi:Sulfotransferase family